MPNHSFVHIEMSSVDAQAMKAFYGAAFGWTFADFPEMNYTTFATGEGQIGGGFNPVSEDNPAGTMMVYIDTDDLTATVNKIKAAGGMILLEGMEIPTVGTMGIFKDPSGNTLALLQPPPGM